MINSAGCWRPLKDLRESTSMACLPYPARSEVRNGTIGYVLIDHTVATAPPMSVKNVTNSTASWGPLMTDADHASAPASNTAKVRRSRISAIHRIDLD